MHYRQQRLQEMARNVVNSRLFSARNFILTENTQFRSSPLLVAAKRWWSAYDELGEKDEIRNKLIINVIKTITKNDRKRFRDFKNAI